MRISFNYVWVVTLVVASIDAAVPPPSQDSFYTQPSNITSYSPGQVIRSRTIKPNLNGIIANVSISIHAAYQYLYRTTDSFGKSVAAVTTLLVPNNANASQLLSYQTAYDSANNDCSPSYTLQAGANSSDAIAIVFIAAALNQGWYVLTSDYEGLTAEYTAGIISGYATLDSIRAALSQNATSGLDPHAKYALTGYSGGSIATEWATELQPGYAPELNIQGASIGGVIANITTVPPTINNGSNAGLAFAAIYGLSKAYPNLTTWLSSNLVATKTADFYSIATGCLDQVVSRGANKDIYSYFRNGNKSIAEPVPASVLSAAGIMGKHGIPKVPLFVYKAVGDEISPVADTDRLVSTLCSKGAIIEYHRDLVGDHATGAVFGSGDSLSWLSDRLNGIAVPNKACEIKNVTLSSGDLKGVVELGEELVSVLEDLLGLQTGILVSG